MVVNEEMMMKTIKECQGLTGFGGN